MGGGMRFSLYCMVLATGGLSGCVGPTVEQVTAQCQAKALQELPPQMVSRVETRYRTEQRPTGRTNCYADNSGGHLVDSTRGNAYRDPSGAICMRQMKDVQVPYRVRTESDQNEMARAALVSACVGTQRGSRSSKSL